MGMRLFLGTFVKSNEIETSYQEIKEKFQNVIEGKWVEPWNLHFTYHFLGDVEYIDAKRLFMEIKDICRVYDDELEFVGLGTFPQNRNPKVLFMEIIDNKLVLQEIHSMLGKVLVRNGFEIDEREFHPHLTLLRVKHSNTQKVLDLIYGFKNRKFGSIKKFEVNLIESKLTSKGPKYSTFSF